MRAPVARALAVGVVAAALVGGLAVDRDHDGAAEPVRFGQLVNDAMPAVPGADVLSSSWYCPGVPAPGDGRENGTVSLVNTATTTVAAVVTARSSVPPAAGQAASLEGSRDVEVPPGGRLDVRLAELAPSPDDQPVGYAAAVVEVAGTGVVVEQTAITARGTSTSPCATSASGTWYLAAGSTTLDDRLVYTLLNPFPDDAVVDIDLATEQGSSAVEAFVVPGRSLRVLHVEDVVRRRQVVGASIVARTGRVVVGRIEDLVADAAPPPAGEAPDLRSGLSSGLGAPSLVRDAAFAVVEKGPGVATSLVVSNPGEVQALVEVVLNPAGGLDPVVGEPEPLELTVPPRSVASLELPSETLIPDGLYAARLRAANDVPFAVQRVVDWTDVGGAPAHSSLVGATRLATSWVVAAGEVGPTVAERLFVANRSTDATSASIRLLTPGGTASIGLDAVAVAGLGVAAVDLPPSLPAGPVGLVVDGGGVALLVERQMRGAPAPVPSVGVSSAFALPVDPVAL